MTLREQLLSNKPKTQPIDINGTTYYLRELTVGETNKHIFGQRQHLIKLAQEQGLELDFENEEALQGALKNVYDQHALTRQIAIRLCDENGNNLFDPENDDDLAELAKLDKSVFEIVTEALSAGEPKNSASEESSS
ncbi:hypothetical protein C5N92_04640 [Glaesserella australis]|uniref:Uncharacterized protein n=2 Tax=Pasteurellaceae TaxID=712 RepID=A0A328C001_9PAST|nr:MULTISPECIES: hypothetical protein [Glaesserella]AUI65626.1 hypothetical protein CJD39_03125 [Glaesserella sp. 15-184]RAL19087.1 hypothetical protein C5N92_04640 [Glaesserella australis]